MERAVIEIDKRDRQAGLEPRISVQFNPAEYSMAKGAQFAEIAIPGIDAPILQFVRGQTQTLTMELFFDTTASGMGEDAVSVKTKTEPVYRLSQVQSETHAPPRVTFFWGELSFKAIVDNVQQKFTLFNPNGVPLRATLSVSFKEYQSLEEQLARKNWQSADHSKKRMVKRNETLALIAFREYGDAGLWRHIYDDQNNRDLIPHPQRLQPGIEITIPAIAGVPRSGGTQ
jgi:nucleoid-associated protein YgaU